MPKTSRAPLAITPPETRSTVVKTRRAGRPPTGPGGVRVSDYPHVMIRLPQSTKDTLEALSGVTGVPVWQLVDRSVRAYVDQLPQSEQKLILNVKKRRARMATES